MTARIRLAGESDAGSIAAIYRPIVDATAISFEPSEPLCLADVRGDPDWHGLLASGQSLIKSE